MSFEDVRNAFVMAYGDGFLNDEEFLFLYDYYKPGVNPSCPHWNFDLFCLDSFNLCECEAHFSVAKDDLPILLNNLKIPATFKCAAEWKEFCLMLKLFGYPCGYFDVISPFARPIPELCMITNTVLDLACKQDQAGAQARAA